MCLRKIRVLLRLANRLAELLARNARLDLELKNALDGIDPTQLEKLSLYVRLGEIEQIAIVDDELVITLEFVDTGMGDDPPTFGAC